jgi:hypothetical protein
MEVERAEFFQFVFHAGTVAGLTRQRRAEFSPAGGHHVLAEGCDGFFERGQG